MFARFRSQKMQIVSFPNSFYFQEGFFKTYKLSIMRKLLLFTIALLVAQLGYGQLTGIKTIPGDYASIQAAITALNAQGVGSGGVTFNVAAGYTETFTAVNAGLITTVTSSSANPIIFQKSGAGTNPLVTASLNGTGTADYIFAVAGTDYITFDGISIQENAGNTTGTTQMEWGYAILKASATDGSQNVTIKNCGISLNKANTVSYGIYSNNVTPAAPTTQLTVTAATGANSNNKFYNNAISNVYGGIYLYGYADVTSPYAYYDQGNDIGSVTGNTLTNFAGGASTAYGFYIAYQNALLLANTGINGGAATTGTIYGIYLATSTNASGSIYANTITLTSGGTTSYIYGLYNSGFGASGTSNTLNIYGNTIQNCTYPTITSAYFYGIYNAAAAFTINFYNNSVSNNLIDGSGYMYLCYTTSASGGTANVYNNTISNNQRTGLGTQSGTSVFYCLYLVGSATYSIHDNNIFGNSIGPVGPSYGGGIYSMYCSNSSPSQTIYNNSIHDQTITSTYTSSCYLYGIYSFPASTSQASVYNNNIYNLTISLNSTGTGYIYGLYSYYQSAVYGNNVYNNNVTNAGTGYGYGYGIYINGSTNSVNVYKNKLYGVSMAGASGYYYGMYIGSGVTINVYNNYISDLKAPVSTSTTGLYGVYIGGGTNVNLYYNTIYLNGTSTSTTTWTSVGVYASTTPNVELRNNIIINKSTAPASTTYSASAYKRSSTTLTTYAATSNNNDFYAGTPSATNVIYTDGTNTDQTLAGFKSRVTPRDAGSITENPPFVNTTTTPYDLHINAAVPTQCESLGSIVSTPNITEDYDGNARYPNAGYPVNGSYPPIAPDLGADEFGGIPLDATPPNIIFTPLVNTSVPGVRTLTTSISDAAGVPTSGIGLPVLYWKINSGAYQPVTATYVSGSTYTFTFGAGTVLNDVVSYYVVAQDMISPAPNVGSSPANGASGFTYNPPACSTPPTTPNFYIIVGTLSGTYAVGAGQTYTTITAAIADLNLKEVVGPVTFELWDATYPSETFPLIIYTYLGMNASRPVTFKPKAGVTATVTGAPATGILVIYGADYITINGSNSGGTDRSLTFENTNSAASTYVIGIFNNGIKGAQYTTIKNCIVKGGGKVNSTWAIILNALGGDFDNTTIQNNLLLNAMIGMQFVGVSTGITNNGVITQNVFGSTDDALTLGNVGLNVSNVDGLMISNNTFQNFKTNTNPKGINISTNSLNTTITGNTITGIIYTGTGGYGGKGMDINTSSAASNMVISNNAISQIKGDGWSTFSSDAIVGIRILGATGGIKIYHNSINLTGNLDRSGATADVSAALYVVSTATNLDVRNNILLNSMENTTGVATAYSIYSDAAATAYTTINYNDYWVSGPEGVLGYIGAAQKTTLAAWQGATGQDANSKNIDPVFVSATDLHASAAGLDNQGFYLTAVPQDFAGVNRTNPPDIGAYEFGTNPAVNTLAATGISCEGGTMNGTINANGLTVNSFFDYGLTTAYGSSVAGTPATVTGTTPTAISAALSLPPATTYHYRARGVTSANVIVYGPDMTITSAASTAPLANTLPATNIGSSTATLNGTVNADCASTVVTFEYGITTSYGFTATAAQSPVTGGVLTPVSAAVTGLTINQTYHFRVKAVNSLGTTYGSDLTFTTGANPPTVTTNAATNIGPTSARLNGTVNANAQSSTVWFEAGTSTSYGSVYPATPSTVTGTTPVSVYADYSNLAINSTYHYRCVAQNIGGTTYGSDMTFTTTCPIPAQPDSIYGPVSMCQGTSGHVYEIVAILYVDSYTWSVPAGATITSGQGTTSITVSYGTSAVSGNVSVYGHNICGNGSAKTLAVTLHPLPVPTITGPNNACITHTYNYSTESGMTNYVWTVSAGGQIMTGAGTNTVSVKWNAAGAQAVNVSYTSSFGCPAAAPTTLNVTVGTLPTPSIAGADIVCVNGGLQVYTTQTGFSNYAWTVSQGGTIVSGQGTYQVEVDWTQPGNRSVSVNYETAYGCAAASPATFAVNVMGLPGNAGPIQGPHDLCAGATEVGYNTPPIQNVVDYIWTLPAGATIVDGANTNHIKVNFALDAESGQISVYGQNLCGTGQASPPFDVTVNPIPPTPVASVDETFVLTSSAPMGNQWYLDGTLIDGANGQYYQAEVEGTYWTIVTLNECVSEESNHVVVIFTGIGEPNGSSFSIYPIPNDGKFTATIVIPDEDTFSIMVYNDLGVKVYDKKDIQVDGKTQLSIDLNNPGKGVYTVVFQGNDQTVIRKVLVTK
jgi:trimeric autotransporter adhesin